MTNKTIKCGKISISNSSSFTLIAGPCQLENEKHALDVATQLKKNFQDKNTYNRCNSIFFSLFSLHVILPLLLRKLHIQQTSCLHMRITKIS